MSEFGGLQKHKQTQHALRNNSWAGASYHMDVTALIWVNVCNPSECAFCSNLRRFEPWWPCELRLLKFFIHSFILKIIIMLRVVHISFLLLFYFFLYFFYSVDFPTAQWQRRKTSVCWWNVGRRHSNVQQILICGDSPWKPSMSTRGYDGSCVCRPNGSARACVPCLFECPFVLRCI